ncbi:MAG: ABC-2 family transporter protein, partial [Ktedonobacteraceae bacterium]|nr:ABC-2 family transporter protein [Ktedonobacteraceae bacterium]
MGFFSGQINTGQLDHVLLRPLSSLYMVSLGKAAPLELSQVLIGQLVIALGLGELPSWWGLLGWLILVATGVIVAWATRVLLACLPFWTPSLELAVFYHALWQFARYPVTIYRQPLRFIFTYILPFAFIATFPAGVLTGRASALLLLPG